MNDPLKNTYSLSTLKKALSFPSSSSFSISPTLDSQKKNKMKTASAIICSLLLITLHSSSLLPVADSRNPFPGKNTSCLSHSQNGSNFEQGGLVGLGGKEDPEAAKGGSRGLMGRIGSRPPSCAHRCGGCSPCDAIQIPAITDRRTMEYANYEPEGWKCKCGPHFFDP